MTTDGLSLPVWPVTAANRRVLVPGRTRNTIVPFSPMTPRRTTPYVVFGRL